MSQEDFIVYTDGGCKGNPGPGGWAYIMRYGDRYREAWGGDPYTTNNRMELTAVIKALSFLDSRIEDASSSASNRSLESPPSWTKAQINIFTDSMYVKNGITKWLAEWKKRSWKTSAKKPVMNLELWQELDSLCCKLEPHFEWVAGHAGNIDNERCDKLVHLAIEDMLRQKESGTSIVVSL
jgi:ribonuclease HI